MLRIGAADLEELLARASSRRDRVRARPRAAGERRLRGPTDGGPASVQPRHQRTKWRATMTQSLTHTIGSAGRLAILSEDDLRRLDEAALDVLAETGVSIPSERARAALVAQGATADGARVTLPRELVRRLVDLAPARMTLGARAGAPIVTGERSLLTTDGCCVEIYDLETGREARHDGRRRRHHQPRRRRAARGRLLLAGRERAGQAGGGARPARAVPGHRQHRQARADGDGRRARPRRGRGADGAGRERLGGASSAPSRRSAPCSAPSRRSATTRGRWRPAWSSRRPASPSGSSPCRWAAPPRRSPWPARSSWASPRRSAPCASIQAAFPGAPVFICFIPSVMDLKSGDFTGGAPEDTIMAAAVGDVGHFYGLPTQCGVNSSGAKEPSWQSALDDTTTSWLSLAAGVDMLTGVGMVSGGRIFSYEEMALGVETLSHARAIAAGVDADGRRRFGRRAGAARRRPVARRRPGAPPLDRRRPGDGARPRARAGRPSSRRRLPAAGARRRGGRRAAASRTTSTERSESHNSLHPFSPSASSTLAFRVLCCINPTRIRRAGGVRHRTFLTRRWGPPSAHPHRWVAASGEGSRKGRRHEKGQDLHSGGGALGRCRRARGCARRVR